MARDSISTPSRHASKSRSPFNSRIKKRRPLKSAVDHLFERKSVLREYEIVAEALNQNLGSVDLKKVDRSWPAPKRPDLSVWPVMRNRSARNTPPATAWPVRFGPSASSKKTNGTVPALNPSFVPITFLSAEQSQAVKDMLRSPDQLQSFRGVAGSGKTTTLREVERGITEAGLRAFSIAPTASAAKTLHEEGFANATTLADFLKNGPSKFTLNGGVVLCDEAGLQSNRQGEALLRMAQKYHLRVIFVGDSRQHDLGRGGRLPSASSKRTRR